GAFQFPEKFIPLFITNALEDRPLPLYGDGRNVRDWLRVEDHCDALERVLAAGRPGEVYHVGGNCERENLSIARAVCAAAGRPDSLIQLVADRRAHDRRYGLDCSKLEHELGFRPGPTIEANLPTVVRWYDEHRDWWTRIKQGEYRSYYERIYGA